MGSRPVSGWEEGVTRDGSRGLDGEEDEDAGIEMDTDRKEDKPPEEAPKKKKLYKGNYSD